MADSGESNGGGLRGVIEGGRRVSGDGAGWARRESGSGLFEGAHVRVGLKGLWMG